MFAGFRPSNEADEDRTAVGAYVDLEANVTATFLASAALRGSVQNGFRAPSLPQQFFATTSTNFIDGVPFDITTFPVSDPIAVALGAQPLDAEESFNVSIGAVLQLGEISITAIYPV